LEIAFRRTLGTLWAAYQPVVAPRERLVIAHEALMRSREAELPNPPAVIRAAERLGRVHDVGRTVRRLVATAIDANTTDTEFFVNLHTQELLDDDLYSATAPLTRHAKRVVFEITERGALEEIPNIRKRALQLREMGFRIAIDDLGAGYAGLSSFAILEPDVVKIDMSLVRGIERELVKQRLVRSVVSLGQDLGIMVIAEGVETEAERDQLFELGCGFHQGWLYAKAAEGFSQIAW